MQPIPQLRQTIRDYAQFGLNSTPVTATGTYGVAYYEATHILWYRKASTDFDATSQSSVATRTGLVPVNQRLPIEIYNIKIRGQIQPLLVNAEDGSPCNYPGIVEWMLIASTSNLPLGTIDPFQQYGTEFLPLDTLWARSLFYDNSGIPEYQVIDFGSESISPHKLRDDSISGQVPWSYDIAQNPETGVGTIIPIPASGDYGTRNFSEFAGGANVHAKVKVDKSFHPPQRFSKDCELRMIWRFSCQPDGNTWFPSLQWLWPDPNFSVRIQGLLEVEYRIWTVQVVLINKIKF